MTPGLAALSGKGVDYRIVPPTSVHARVLDVAVLVHAYAETVLGIREHRDYAVRWIEFDRRSHLTPEVASWYSPWPIAGVCDYAVDDRLRPTVFVVHHRSPHHVAWTLAHEVRHTLQPPPLLLPGMRERHEWEAEAFAERAWTDLWRDLDALEQRWVHLDAQRTACLLDPLEAEWREVEAVALKLHEAEGRSATTRSN